MSFSTLKKLFFGQPASPPSVAPRRPRRRGATALEYLAVISFIFIVAMTGINYFAQATKQTLENSSEAIQKASEGKK
jgi:Flp pilus assembly pilin Flp